MENTNRLLGLLGGEGQSFSNVITLIHSEYLSVIWCLVPSLKGGIAEFENMHKGPTHQPQV